MKPFERQKAEANEKLQPYSLKIVSRNQIDTNQWDRCIANAINETPFAYSWVLDYFNPQWSGLIINNYDGVMPLPQKRIMGFKSIQMPVEVNALGIFSNDYRIIDLSPHILNHPVLSNYKYINYSFIPTEALNINQPAFDINLKTTYELSLRNRYEDIYKNYSKSHQKNIRRFARNNLEIIPCDIANAYKTLQQQRADENPALIAPHDHNRRFTAMVKKAMELNFGENYVIFNQSNIIGAAFFLTGKKRIVVFHISDNQGRELETTFGLIDHFVKKHAGEDKILDFAGSSIPNIAKFNEGFGAVRKDYPNIIRNNLPWPLNLIKQHNLLHRIKRLVSK
jgi:hypothetical protein